MNIDERESQYYEVKLWNELNLLVALEFIFESYWGSYSLFTFAAKAKSSDRTI